MKFGQLLEYNMRQNVLEKLYTTISRPYSKKSKLSIFLAKWSKVLYSLFLLYAKLRAIKIY